MSEQSILTMAREGLLALRPEDITRYLTPDEVVHIARTLDAFWVYDYKAVKQGKPGMHALLKSERHSDGFLVSKILLEPENILRIMANQITMRYRDTGGSLPDWVAGVPDGATALGKAVTNALGVRNAKMVKVDGRISLVTPIRPTQKLLLVEDFCTRGTGFAKAVTEVKRQSPYAVVLHCSPVIVNRGGLKTISVKGIGDFSVLPVVERRILDWDPADNGCPLCARGSTPIRPKATDENWRLLTTSQE
ncbi:MAG: hypothetical protein UY60_C0017G0014 [Parcubacteria group bacterium GW2011_GWB1_50_9]|uniref:Orotate phosphoribosyltransferase n=1 Tax=Candidatus Adlerbacteria bacterium GW2011_GWC1_50_9 TaxID=1618608 RepID=A0A0G1WN46_9BACT|nr:MAG: hypothetical protein UY60_C0017G0014 [Parcubacteria group bacterium GW2011_GWB1_50_9]KKW20186.1 MAG: hypothetical protein UY61_C0043G0003 [Candidatus Adlerbacteria bacterium GW2011_GWC1_50_9]